ncbi:hypothetical protein NE237_018857 [Protea cynaroides]|uniref:Uncharacterized protein n=1 Tax=Protea cynaroides TaxID=273540 RepID=A0A9Q0KAN4_9MAGN|nr:hypothetical protein NE237_018857 [Protea cynaroides]
MEKPSRSKGNLLTHTGAGARAGAASLTFHNPPISPNRDMRPENFSRFKANTSNKGFSLIPAEARRKSRNGSFDATEPTSPKVSCMGQIKHKHKKLKNKNQKKLKSTRDSCKLESSPREEKKKPSSAILINSSTLSTRRDFCKLESSTKEEKKKPSSTILRIFRNKKSDNSDVVFDDPDKEASVQIQDRAPSLGQMKRFASGHDYLANFDWTAQTPVASDDQNYHSDERVMGNLTLQP